MPTEEALTRMLRSLGAERLRLDREIRRLEKIVGEPDKLSVSYPPPSYELLKRLQIRGDCVTTGDDTKITTRILR